MRNTDELDDDDLTVEIRVFLPDTEAALLVGAAAVAALMLAIGVLVNYAAGTPVCLYGSFGFGPLLFLAVWMLSRQNGNATHFDLMLAALQMMSGGYEPGGGRIRVGPKGVEISLEPFPTPDLEARPWDES